MIRCEPFCYLVWAVLILLLPIDWLLSAATAALVHELCHILAVRIFGGRIRRIRICVTGCGIECDELLPVHGTISILAGPMGSLSLLALRRYLPQIAVCGLIQGLFNLLPVLPLDGGRLLRQILYRCLPAKADAILRGIRYAVLLLFFCLLLWGMWLSGWQ